MDKIAMAFYTEIIKEAKKKMPHFEEQDRPEKVKEIYRALKRDHPNMPAEMKARIAARQGKPGKQKQGPPYKGEIDSEYSEAAKKKDEKRVERTTKAEREKMSKEAGIMDFARSVGRKLLGAAPKVKKVIRKVTSNAEMLADFKSRPYQERAQMLAKLREMVNHFNPEIKRKATVLLGILERA